jgi:hypothetical protein
MWDRELYELLYDWPGKKELVLGGLRKSGLHVQAARLETGINGMWEELLIEAACAIGEHEILFSLSMSMANKEPEEAPVGRHYMRSEPVMDDMEKEIMLW